MNRSLDKVKPIKVLHICLVEDDIVDAEHFTRLIQKTGVIYQLHHVTDGASALAKIKELIEYKIYPLLIALDLKMPLMGGEEILKYLKKSHASAKYDLIVTTTSDAPDDLKIIDNYKINAYILKSRLSNDLPNYIKNKYIEI